MIVDTISAGATLTLAVLVCRWTKKSDENDIARITQNDWRDYNLAVLADIDLQKIEAENHIVEGLSNFSNFEIKKMCIYFIKLNVPYNMWIAGNNELLEPAQVEREILNQSKLLYSDRDFVETNIFPRGYDPIFCDLVRVNWKSIDTKDLTLE